MTSLRLTPNQRLLSGAAALVLAGFCMFVLAPIDGPGWYFVAVVLLAIAFVITQLPAATSAPRAQAAPEQAIVWEVPVAFVGEAALIHDRLEGAGWTVGTSGPAAAEGEGVLTLEVPGGEISREGARAMAVRAVKTAGALVERVGDARRIR